MDVGQYALGVALGAASLAPLIAGALRLRLRLVPDATGATALTATGVIVAGLVVLAAEVAGVIGVLSRPGVLLSSVVVGGLAWVLGRRSGGPNRRAGPAAGPRRKAEWRWWLTVVAVAIVGAVWLGWTVFAYRHGMETIDTLWYHLPQAARWVQLGNIRHIQFFDSSATTAYYPANAELLHALGLVWFRSDLLSPLINLLWAALAIGAAWSIGSRYGQGPGCVLALVLVFGTPGLVDTQPGGAYNDVVCIALLLAAAAMLLADASDGTRGETPVGSTALAACASGLAIGTKFTMIIPMLALALGAVAISPRGQRARNALIWVGGLALMGGYWYVRNWTVTGNPLPSLGLHLGPLTLAAAANLPPSHSVAEFLTNGAVWRAIFVPGLRLSLGIAWPGLVALSAAGAIGSLALAGDRRLKLLGAVAVVSVVGFVVSPQELGNPPVLFWANVRYAAPALILGLVLLPVLHPLRRPGPATALLGLLFALLVATELDPGVWPTGLHLRPFSPPLSGPAAWFGGLLAVIAAAAVASWTRVEGWLRAHAPERRLAALTLSAAMLAVGLGAGWAVADSYVHRRYMAFAVAPVPEIYAWAERVHHTRIGLVGLQLQYPLYGADDSNYVQYIGAQTAHGGFAAIASCVAWRRAVNRGDYRWLLITPPVSLQTGLGIQAGWTATSSAAHLVLRQPSSGPWEASLYRLSGSLDPRGCGRAGAA